MNGAGLPYFILRRIAIAVPLLLIISLGVFALVHVAPGDPARALLGSRPSDPATLAAIRERYHLNDPFIVQYGKWLWQVLQGDFGRSIQGNQMITKAIGQRLGVTIYLTVLGTLFVLGVGTFLGALAAFRRGSRLDRAVVMLGVFGVSSPAFVTGILLLYLFGVVLGWFPTFGAGRGFADRLWHLALPAIALGISVMAIIVKIARAAMIEEITAAGLIVVALVAQAIYVEVTFALPGLGSLMIDAVQKRDIPLIQGTTLLFSAFVVVVNLLIDVIYTLIDPRIRFGRVES
jgi:peptide/nickel transport system permease protein